MIRDENGGPVFIPDKWHKWVLGDDSTCELSHYIDGQPEDDSPTT